MKICDIAGNVISGQIISRVEGKEEIGDVIIETRKVLIPKAMASGVIVHNDLGFVKLKKNVDENRITKLGDVVIKLTTPYDSVLIDQENEGLIVPSFCVVMRDIYAKKIEPLFLVAYLNTTYTRELLKSKITGATVPILKISDIKDLDIPEVKLETQRLLGEAYQVSISKLKVLRSLIENEELLMENLVLKSVKEVL